MLALINALKEASVQHAWGKAIQRAAQQIRKICGLNGHRRGTYSSEMLLIIHGQIAIGAQPTPVQSSRGSFTDFCALYRLANASSHGCTYPSLQMIHQTADQVHTRCAQCRKRSQLMCTMSKPIRSWTPLPVTPIAQRLCRCVRSQDKRRQWQLYTRL